MLQMVQTSNPDRAVPTRRISFEESLADLPKHFAGDGNVLASHIIADEGWRAPSSLSDGFDRLRDHGVIQPSTAQALRRAVGLRNVIAHGYAGVDPEAVHAASTQGLTELDAFAREVARWMATLP